MSLCQGVMANLPKLVMVTCYDATFARICADTGAIDYLLAGDSVGMVVGGHSTTLPVTMDHMIYHSEAVARGILKSTQTQKPILIADMPAHSYDTVEDAVKNAKRLLKTGAQMVKVEGGVYEVVHALRSYDIRVCAHIGLTPQSIHDFKLQGKTQAEAERLRAEAKGLQTAGAELLVLEMIPTALAEQITKDLKIPTIGIGAGAQCSGQVLVLYDLLGLNPDFNPKFLKKYLNGYTHIREALENYSKEVKENTYPDSAHSFQGL